MQKLAAGYEMGDPEEQITGTNLSADPKFVKPPIDGVPQVPVPSSFYQQGPKPDHVNGAPEKPVEPSPLGAVEPVDPQTYDEARLSLVRVQDEYNQQGRELQQLEATLHLCRNDLGIAARTLDALTPQPTREEAAREFIRQGLAERAARARGELPVRTGPVPGPSAIDRAAFYGQGGSAEDMARKNHQTGWRRGAFPASRRVLKGNIG